MCLWSFEWDELAVFLRRCCLLIRSLSPETILQHLIPLSQCPWGPCSGSLVLDVSGAFYMLVIKDWKECAIGKDGHSYQKERKTECHKITRE